jgi:hypothetical protein
MSPRLRYVVIVAGCLVIAGYCNSFIQYLG